MAQEIRMLRTTVDNKQQLMHKNERYKVNEVGSRYAEELVRLKIAEYWNPSPKMQKDTFIQPKKVLSKYHNMTVTELKQEAKELEGFKHNLKKAELIQLLENANR